MPASSLSPNLSHDPKNSTPTPPASVPDLVIQVFPPILYAFPMCCVVWTWDSLFYGASDFVYNAKTVAVASFCGVVGASPALAGIHVLGLLFSCPSHAVVAVDVCRLWRLTIHGVCGGYPTGCSAKIICFWPYRRRPGKQAGRYRV